VSYPQRVETFGPLVQVGSLGDEELKMVKTRSEFVEQLAKAGGVFDEADLLACAWFYEASVALALVQRFICTADGESE